MSSNRLTRVFTALALASVIACGGDAAEQATPEAETAPPAEAAAEPVSVTIVTPAEGAALTSGDVEVTITAAGIEIAPVADGRIGTAHGHLFLDVDLSAEGEMIPQDNPRIIHMGDGRMNHTFTGVEAGEHRIIAVLADLAHVPLVPLVADTVTFRVGGS